MQTQIPEEYIVNRKPKEYLKQGKVHCGVYTAKAVLEGFGKSLHKDPVEYHVNFLNKITGCMFRCQDLVNVFKKYGLKTKVMSAKDLEDEQKLQVLKKILLNNRPIPVFISNGYRYTKNGTEYNKLKSFLVGHIISIWGYNDKEKVFYIYDSTVPKSHYNKISIGNIKRTYKELLRDWQGATYYRFLKPYVYLEILD